MATTTPTPATTFTDSTSPGHEFREVTFPSADIELAGTLRLPEGESVPGVVLIHGSGPNSRDATVAGQLNMGFGFTIPIFAELGDALQDAGFAVLSYDKRSCGPFNGCADNGYLMPGDDIVVDDFITDAEAAVAFRRSQPEVDPDRVSVVGHSQGAEFVTLMLAADSQLANGVMLAGPYRPIDEINEFQYFSSLDLLVSLLGFTREQAVNELGDFGMMLRGLADIRNGGTEPVSGVSATFWNSWFDLGNAKIEAVAASEQPVLILAGGYDWNMPVSEAEAWDELFTEAGREHTTVVLDCITHGLNCVSEPDITAIGADDIGEHVSQDVIDALVSFLTE